MLKRYELALTKEQNRYQIGTGEKKKNEVRLINILSVDLY